MGRFLSSLVLMLGLLAPQAASATESAVEWQNGDALFLAGANVEIDRNIDSDVRASADSIVLSDDAEIDGDAWLAGRRIVVDGAVSGNLDVRGQTVLVNGPISGDVSVWSVDLTLGPDAVIDGDLTYYTTSAADIADDAKVSGTIEANSFSDERGGDYYNNIPDEWRDEWERNSDRNVTIELSLPGVLLMALFAGAISFISPRWSGQVQQAAREAPALATFYGVVWMLGLPLIGILAALTIVGVPFAFLLMVLYGIVFLAGMVIAVLVIGGAIMSFFTDMEEQGTIERIAVLLVGSLVLWAGAAAPILGGFFWFASIALGIGGILIAGRVRYVSV